VIRKRNDSVKPGVGINKDLGSDYTKQHRTDPWDSNPKGNYKSPRGAGAYQDGNADFLRNVPPGAGTGGTGESLQGGTHDILDDVEANANAGTDRTGPIKYGVD
jgi:hypothetical protein